MECKVRIDRYAERDAVFVVGYAINANESDERTAMSIAKRLGDSHVLLNDYTKAACNGSFSSLLEVY